MTPSLNLLCIFSPAEDRKTNMNLWRWKEIKKGKNISTWIHPTGRWMVSKLITPVVKGFFVPKLCNHCRNSPCTQVCPVGATFYSPDGVVLIDRKHCIGCGYCVQACPYGCRYINHGHSKEEHVTEDHGAEAVGVGDSAQEGISQEAMAAESYDKTTIGTADKCTLCYHRIHRDLETACVYACPREARICGNLKDPNSRIRKILHQRRYSILKADLATNPKCYYLGLDLEVK